MAIRPHTLYTVSCDGYPASCDTVYTRRIGPGDLTAYLERSYLTSDLAHLLTAQGWMAARLLLCPDCSRRFHEETFDRIQLQDSHEPLFPLDEDGDARQETCYCSHLTPGVRPHPHDCVPETGMSWAQVWAKRNRGVLKSADPARTGTCRFEKPEFLTLLADAYDAGRHDERLLPAFLGAGI